MIFWGLSFCGQGAPVCDVIERIKGEPASSTPLVVKYQQKEKAEDYSGLLRLCTCMKVKFGREREREGERERERDRKRERIISKVIMKKGWKRGRT